MGDREITGHLSFMGMKNGNNVNDRMSKLILGIHHVTALADSPQKNIDFYAGVLGMRLVKKTVNFDAPNVYHLYYGDDQGTPGTILTFFPYEGIERGRHGKGMINVISFSVPFSSIEYWQNRLKKFNIVFKPPRERFQNETAISFEDHDGLQLELVFNDRDTRPGYTSGRIPLEHSIKGFYGVEIWEEGYERTESVLTGQMDHRLIAEKDDRHRFASNDAPGNYVDIICSPDSQRGLGGKGTVHHMAFATPDMQTQVAARNRIVDLNPTLVIDRQYFKSVYFREPGGVLFEIATIPPGFSIDESQDNLGSTLKLPPQYEQNRARLEEALTPVTVNLENY